MTLWPIPPAETSRFAAQEFRRLQAEARAAVASRQLTADKAERRLKAWLAIAALARADLPELVEALAPLRTRSVMRPGMGWREEEVNEGEARADLAQAICPNGEWRRELERATDTALARAFDPETSARAAQFLALARALHVPFTTAPKKEPVA